MRVLLPLLLLAGASALARTDTAEESAETTETRRQYTYSWLFADDDAMKPRGGTTRGSTVTLATEPSEAWLALQEEGLSTYERDRRAILAMAGEYRTSFDFIETIGFTGGYAPTQPYQSWGTERVYVVADEEDFISLQHVLVMQFANEEGEVVSSHVVKHWRHDWRYEDRDLHVYAGDNGWRRERLSRQDARGAWTQAVYQVDDSPRYEGVGRWDHKPGYSTWTSERTWRPLPRREFSVRDDYHVLEGTNRISITPTGWVQDEDALKLVLDEQGQPDAKQPYLAREAGLSRYDRIVGFDFTPGDEYWASTGPFWAEVRATWEDVYDRDAEFALNKVADGEPLYAAMFSLASKYGADPADPEAMRADVEDTLARYFR